MDYYIKVSNIFRFGDTGIQWEVLSGKPKRKTAPFRKIPRTAASVQHDDLVYNQQDAATDIVQRT